MSYFPPTGSTVAFQTDATKLAANVSVTGGFLNVLGSVATAPFPGSVSGVGTFNVNPIGSGSVFAVLKDSSVAALQGTNPWKVELTSGSVITTGGNSSVQVVGLMPPQSVSGVGTFNINPIGSGSVFAVLRDSSVAALQGTNPWMVQLTSGSVITTGGNSSVLVVGVMPPQSVSGVGLFNVNHTGNGSILTVSLGSIATAPFPASVSGVGQFNVNHTGPGSIFTVWPLASIAGTYAEDTAHTSGERGLFTLGVRGDMVTSLVSANLDYGPIAVDSFGRTVNKPFAPEEARVYGVASTVNTGPSSLLAASGTGLRNYVTDLMIANTGSVATLVSFRDVDASVIGRTIAPSGGGSNMIHFATPMRTHALNSQVEYTAATAVSILHVTAFGYKAP